MQRDVFEHQLRANLESHLTLDHPIFLELLTGEPNWNLLRFMALQGYQLASRYKTLMEPLYFWCRFRMHKTRLLCNLYEEETGRLSKTKNHVMLMQDFVRAIGISDAERDAAGLLPKSQRLMDYRMALVMNPDTHHMGAAAVLVASEGQNLEKKDGLSKHALLAKRFGLTEDDTRFFSVHATEDIGHVQEGLDLVVDLCDTEQRQQEALDAIDATCRLFYEMYDGIAEQYHMLQPS